MVETPAKLPKSMAYLQSETEAMVRESINKSLRGIKGTLGRLVMGQANKLWRDGLLLSCWTLDGNIFVKTLPGRSLTRIFSEEDHTNFFN